MVWRSDRSRNLRNYGGTSCGLITDYASESSESEFVEDEEKPWPPLGVAERTGRSRRRAPRLPRPHSHLFRGSDGRMRGSKHVRRWENSMFLRTLHPISEEEWSEGVSILSPHSTAFTKLLTDDKSMQIWCSFTSLSEEEQERRVMDVRGARREGGEVCEEEEEEEGVVRGEKCEGGETPERRFRRIDRRIKTVLQHNRNLPLELLSEMEEELEFCFSLDRRAVVVVLQSNKFHRLLLHGVCQYLELTATSVQIEGACVMIVECRVNRFTTPSAPLTDLLGRKK